VDINKCITIMMTNNMINSVNIESKNRDGTSPNELSDDLQRSVYLYVSIALQHSIPRTRVVVYYNNIILEVIL